PCNEGNTARSVVRDWEGNAGFGMQSGSCSPAGIARLFIRRTTMRWSSGGESEDIEDRRDESGGGGGFQFGGMHIGIGGAIILLILSFIFRTNLFTLLSGGTGEP